MLRRRQPWISIWIGVSSVAQTFDSQPHHLRRFVDLVFRRFLRLFRGNDAQNLTRSSALFESLGSITAICSVDKEGTIAMASLFDLSVFVLPHAHLAFQSFSHSRSLNRSTALTTLENRLLWT